MTVYVHTHINTPFSDNFGGCRDFKISKFHDFIFFSGEIRVKSE